MVYEAERALPKTLHASPIVLVSWAFGNMCLTERKAEGGKAKMPLFSLSLKDGHMVGNNILDSKYMFPIDFRGHVVVEFDS